MLLEYTRCTSRKSRNKIIPNRPLYSTSTLICHLVTIPRRLSLPVRIIIDLVGFKFVCIFKIIILVLDHCFFELGRVQHVGTSGKRQSM